MDHLEEIKNLELEAKAIEEQIDNICFDSGLDNLQEELVKITSRIRTLRIESLAGKSFFMKDYSEAYILVLDETKAERDCFQEQAPNFSCLVVRTGKNLGICRVVWGSNSLLCSCCEEIPAEKFFEAYEKAICQIQDLAKNSSKKV